MRNFIVSDLHGNGNAYYSIMSYLDNINKDDEVTLYINGDLIDRGNDSAEILLDVRNRIINNNSFKINYLGGNHELMMYQALHDDKLNLIETAIWFSNGGGVTNDALIDLIDKKEKLEVVKFISELNIYHKFNEKIDDKRIVLVHAKCPKNVNDICDLKIKDNIKISQFVWTRQDDLIPLIKDTLGNDEYFTIIGHTPVKNKKGYIYYPKYNCLNIDGGCAYLAYGNKDYNHIPLVEINGDLNRLDIITFNSNNEIIMGNYFTNKKNIEINENELNKKRKYLDKDVKIKKLEYN